MTQILLETDNDTHAALLLELLGSLRFVRNVQALPASPGAAPPPAEEGDLFALTGIWKGRDLSLETLRERAWPERAR